MKIAVIGWGSLIWSPCELRITSCWRKDGPILPIEFSRVSQDGRLTLVIDRGATGVTTLWALSELDDVKSAAENLRRREGTCRKRIGQVTLETSNPDEIQQMIMAWLEKSPLEAAVWTALPPKKPGGEERLMKPGEAADYIRQLSGETLIRAEQYVSNTPGQVDTPIRRRLRADFGWDNNPPSPQLFADSQADGK